MIEQNILNPLYYITNKCNFNCDYCCNKYVRENMNYEPTKKDIDTLLNNLHIRHNNLEGEDLKEVTVNMSNKDLEEWYDRAYDIMLLALMYNDYLEYKPDIKDLRIKCKTK